MVGSSILVPLDTSAVSERAVPTARWLAALYGADIRLLYVLEKDLDSPWGVEAALSVQRYIEGVIDRYKLGQASVTVKEGRAAPTILAAATDATFLVIGSHGRGGFRATVIGSVADKVIRGARGPVVMVPGADGPVLPATHGPVLIGLDGSPEAEEALEVGRDVAKRAAVPVVLVRAFKMPPPPGIKIAAYPIDLLEAEREEATRYLAAVAHPGEETLAVEGQASDVVVEQAQKRGAALIVMASTGKGFARRIALGSTTSRVMHATPVPLLVVPPRSESAG